MVEFNKRLQQRTTHSYKYDFKKKKSYF